MNLDKFLNEQIARPTELNEGAKEFLRGIVGTTSKFFNSLITPLTQLVSHFVGSVKRVFLKKLNNKDIPAYEEDAPNGTVVGYLYPDTLAKAATKNAGKGSKKFTFCKVYVPSQGGTTKVAFDPDFASNSSASNSVSVNEGKKVYANYLQEQKNHPLKGLLNEIDRSKEYLAKQSTAGVQKNAFSNKMKAAYNTADAAIPSVFNNKDLEEELATAKVSIGDLRHILKELLFSVTIRDSYSQPIPSLLVLGFPGGGKTSLIDAFAEGNNIQIHKMEIASIYKEILGGFPVVEKYLEAGKTLDDVAKDSPKEAEEFNQNLKTKVALKAVDIFPEEDGKIHIFFLDEFNRDAEKMAAAMNLILSGSIGNQYTLPLKTITIASGNLGEDIDHVKVQQLDSATFDRFNAKVMLDRNAADALKFAGAQEVRTAVRDKDGNIVKDKFGKPVFKTSKLLPAELRMDNIEILKDDEVNKYYLKNPQELEEHPEYNLNVGTVVSSLDVFYNVMIEKYGKDLMGPKWEQDLAIKPLHTEYEGDDFEGGSDDMTYQITPRTIEKMNKRLKDRALMDWIAALEGKDTLAEPSELKDWFLKGESSNRYLNLKTPQDWAQVWKEHEDEYVSRVIPSPVALYLHVMQWHPNYIPFVLKQMVGANPIKFINKVKNITFKETQNANKVNIDDIIYGYLFKKGWGKDGNTGYGHDLEEKNEAGETVMHHLEPKEFKDMVLTMTSAKAMVMGGLVDSIIKNYAHVEETVEKVTKHKFSDIAAINPKIEEGLDAVIYNIAAFMKDTGLSVANAAAFIGRLKEVGLQVGTSNNETTGELEQTGNAKNKITKEAVEAISYLYHGLWNKSEVIKNTRTLQAGFNPDDEEEKKPTASSTAPTSGFDPNNPYDGLDADQTKKVKASVASLKTNMKGKPQADIDKAIEDLIRKRRKGFGLAESTEHDAYIIEEGLNSLFKKWV
jgi:hypothetical protein